MALKNSGGIVIYSTKGDIMFSSTGEITNCKKPPRKHRSQKNITHKIFDDMRKYNEEDFWDNVLMKFSRNIFYNDFRLIGTTLYYKYKSKNQREEITLDKNNLEESFEKLKDILRKKGILPVSEIVDDSKILIQPRKKITSWKEAGKNKIILIYGYIDSLEKKYNLNNIEKKRLESLLKILVYSNILNNDHIILEDETIKSIKYFEWDSVNRKFNINIDNIKIKQIKNEKKNEDKFYTINSFSDDNQNLNREIQIETVDKKWEIFLESYYKI